MYLFIGNDNILLKMSAEFTGPELYPGYREEAEAAIGSARRNGIRLEEVRQMCNDSAWATELGRMFGQHLPRIFQDPSYYGQVAQITLKGITPALIELRDRPDLLPIFYKQVMRELQMIGVVGPYRLPNSLTDIQTKYRDGYEEHTPRQSLSPGEIISKG